MPTTFVIENSKSLAYNITSKSWVNRILGTKFIFLNDDEVELYIVKNSKNLYWNYPNNWVSDYREASKLAKDVAYRLAKDLEYMYNEQFTLEILVKKI